MTARRLRHGVGVTNECPELAALEATVDNVTIAAPRQSADSEARQLRGADVEVELGNGDLSSLMRFSVRVVVATVRFSCTGAAGDEGLALPCSKLRCRKKVAITVA